MTTALPLALLGVSARDRAVSKPVGLFRRKAAATPGSIVDVRLEAGTGILAIVGAAEDGTRVLADVLAGRYRPDRGKVLVGGLEPSRNAVVRRGIGYLAPTPELLPGRTVLACVAASLSISREGEARRAAKELLDAFGLAALGERDPRALSIGETRGVELALALSTERPSLVVLYEPFVDVGGISATAVRDRIAALGATALVVVITSSPSDAQIAGAMYTLHRGYLARRGDTPTGLGAFERTELHVWVGSKGRELARALAESKALLGVAWEASADASSDAGTLRVAGPDVAEVALALTDAAVATGAVVTGFRSVSPTLAEIRATTESIRYAQHAAAQAAYRDAYAAQQRQMEEARARAAAPQRRAEMFTGANAAQQAAPSRAWVPASTPPPKPAEPDTPEAIAAQEAKWGPKLPSTPPPGAPLPPAASSDAPQDEKPALDDPGTSKKEGSS